MPKLTVSKDKGPVEWSFVYVDEDGNPLRKVEVVNELGRTRLCQFRHTAQGWKKGADDVRNVPYCLPELIEAIERGDTIFVVEGEHCVSALAERQLTATTNPGGAGKWPTMFNEYFKGSNVVLLPNNDDRGREHMNQVEANLTPVVANLVVLDLPGLHESEDVGDWMANGGTRRMLLTLVDTSPLVADDRSGNTGWDVPLPLDPRSAVPPFPLDALPAFVADYVAAVARSTQTPVDLAGMLALAATATVTAGSRVRIRPGFEVPMNLYLVAVLAVGEGKTPVYRELMRILDAIEYELRVEVAPHISEARARKTVAEANLKLIKKRLNDPRTPPQERADLTPQVETAQLALDEIRVPWPPRLYTQDATPEGLLKVLQQQSGRIAVLDDEGGELFQLLSRYSKSGDANQGVYLRGHDGGRLMSDWSTKETVDLDEVMLTLGLTAQPQVIRDLSADPTLRGRGLLARMLYGLPASDVGYRDPVTDQVPDALREEFAAVMRVLAHDSFESRGNQQPPIRLSAAAQERFNGWARSHEVRLRPDEDLGSIADWGNKLPSQMARIAGNLHALMHPADWIERQVSERTLNRSIEISDYFAEHAKAAFQLMGAEPVALKAIRIVDWLRGKEEVTQREIHRARQGLFDKSAEVTGVVSLLIDHGYLRRAEVEGFRSGGRPSTKLLVNPLIP